MSSVPPGGPEGRANLARVITCDEVMPLLLVACPSFGPTWSSDLERDDVHVNEDGTRLHYLDAGVFATHLVGLHRSGADDEVRAAFAVIERLHVEGDPYVRELASIGYLEDLQGDVRAHPDDHAFVESVLGPESAARWRGLRAFWSGRAPFVTRTTA